MSAASNESNDMSGLTFHVTVRGVIITAATAVASALSVWMVMELLPSVISDAHADEHVEDHEQLEQVTRIAESNALYINEQILAELYIRTQRLREYVKAGDETARDPLARAEVEIRRREKQVKSNEDP